MKYLVNGQEWEPGQVEEVEVSHLSDRLAVRTKHGTSTALVVRSAGKTYVSYRGRAYRIERLGRRRTGHQGDANGESRAPMPGQIVEVSVKEGDVVESGTRLMVLEAMKMQQPVVATVAGRVASLKVEVGSQVGEGDVLAVVEESK